MKRLIPYVLVFILGFAACAYILRAMGYTSGGSTQSVTQALTGKPAPPVVKKGENPIADAAARVGPAVVNIDTLSERQIRNPFQDFGEFFNVPIVPDRRILMGQGSGVIISDDGYILTNNHVVAGATEIAIRLADGRRFKGRLVGRDSQSDLALVKVNAKNLPYAVLGDSDTVRVGDWAIAIGNPLGFGNSVTVGVISATKRKDLPVGVGPGSVGERGVLREAIQTDAAINRGNSGGALVNINGEVIGINTAISSTEPGQGNIGIGFAIPISSVKADIRVLLEKGRIVRPYMGVIVADLSGELGAWYEQKGYKSKKGAVVWEVQPGSPAAKAGLLQGDVITEVDGNKIENAQDVTNIIQKGKVGQVVRISIWRIGRMQLLGVKLAELPQTWSLEER